MRRFYVTLFFLVTLSQALIAAEYKLQNGDILKGEPASVNEDGLVVRLELGGFSPRIAWPKFTQETLKELTANPQAKKFVDPFIEKPVEIKQKERAKKKEIVLKEVPHVDRPVVKGGFVAALFRPPAVVILLLLYAANIYAGIEIGRYKGRPPAVVGAICAFVPLLGPLIFMAAPGFGPGSEYHEVSHDASAAPPPVEPMKGNVAPSSLGLSAQAAKKVDTGEGQLYTRADTSFDRRFFETKFTPFFRLVPAEDKVLVIKTPKMEYVAKRISRISMNEMHLALLRNNSEVPVAFSEITEAQVRQKDAKA